MILQYFKSQNYSKLPSKLSHRENKNYTAEIVAITEHCDKILLLLTREQLIIYLFFFTFHFVHIIVFGVSMIWIGMRKMIETCPYTHIRLYYCGCA